ncbi:MAG: redoxin domain-containing protein [Sedimentisphaerales bacterium]|nr:redoxin domain-containing protein [Sedimentisphaerales bacterium]
MDRSECKAIVCGLVISLIVAGVSLAAEEIKTLEIGAKAPDFVLPGVDGKMHRLSEYNSAKVLVIVFTCNHCPTAQAYEERIKKLAADYKDKGVALVAISPNDPLAVRLDELGYTDVGDSIVDMKIRAKDKGFNFPYLYDGNEQQVSKAYGPMSTPHVFIFDAERKLRYVGRVDNNEKQPEKVTSPDARNAIEALLAGRPVPVEKTKTFGCSIKWSDKRASVRQSLEEWAQEPVTLGMIDLEGVKTVLKNDSNDVCLVNIWSTRCGPCVVEFPEFIEINRMYRGREFRMVSINVEGVEAKGAALSFLKKNQASFMNYVYDGDVYAFIDAVDPRWQGAIPYTLLIKPHGEVVYRHLGQIEPLALKKAVVGCLGRVYK